MIKSIRNYIQAIKDAYRNINSKKFLAEEAIEKYKSETERIGEISKIMEETIDNLKTIYDYLPKEERQDYVQKTLDLLITHTITDQYNRAICPDFGYHWLFDNQYKIMKSHLKVMRLHYNNGHYDDVIDLAKEYNILLENFYVRNKIK